MSSPVPAYECARCEDTGKIRYEKHQVFEPGERSLGDGTYIGEQHETGSHLCVCRSSLEPREGEAWFWDSETVYKAGWEASVLRDTAIVEVKAEIPISKDNYRLVMRGNRYYPTFIDLDVSSTELHAIFPEEARALAGLLIAAAEKAEAIDEPCADECGHWFPCNCTKSPVANASKGGGG